MASLSLNMVSVPPRTTTISCKRTRVPSLPFSFTRRRLTIRATETDTNNVKSQAPDKAPSKHGSSINQLLGIKGTAQESNKWKIRLQLLKPVTWPLLVWGVVCSAAVLV
ncbi:hypothetical protein S83_050789 [Arachis hypogaea]|uniref:Uncharacterized protein n=1 Tax=Arachis hypogaea TaxID=3818 RepID=A0A444Z7F3_ARAHY|nr:hypothetical protein Ahy_B05g078582 [Arachis hypogaea]